MSSDGEEELNGRGGGNGQSGGVPENEEDSDEEEQQFDISLAASHSVCISAYNIFIVSIFGKIVKNSIFDIHNTLLKTSYLKKY